MDTAANNNNNINLVTSLDLKRRLSGLRGRVTRISHQMENLLRFESPTNMLVVERLIKLKHDAWMALSYYESELINSLSTVTAPNNIEIVHFRAKKDNLKKIAHLYHNFLVSASRYAQLLRRRHDHLSSSSSQHKPPTTSSHSTITMTTRQRIRNLILTSAASRKSPQSRKPYVHSAAAAGLHDNHHAQALIAAGYHGNPVAGSLVTTTTSPTTVYLGVYHPLQPILVGRDGHCMIHTHIAA